MLTSNGTGNWNENENENGKERKDPLSRAKWPTKIVIQEHSVGKSSTHIEPWCPISIHFNSHTILKWVRIKTNHRTSETTKRMKERTNERTNEKVKFIYLYTCEDIYIKHDSESHNGNRQ